MIAVWLCLYFGVCVSWVALFGFTCCRLVVCFNVDLLSLTGIWFDCY